MATETINFDCNEFKIDDVELDHEDAILKQELDRLISEQLSNFDLSDEEDQLGLVENDSIPVSSNHLINIFDEEKLSLLEGAIQNFKECSENATTNSNELMNSGCSNQYPRNSHRISDSFGQYILNTHGFQQSESTNNEFDKHENPNNSHSVGNSQHASKGTSSNPAVSLDSSLPDEIRKPLSNITRHVKEPFASQDANSLPSDRTCSLQTSSSAWSFVAPSSHFLSTTNPRICPENYKVLTPSHVTFDRLTQASVPIDTLDMRPTRTQAASNEVVENVPHKNVFIPSFVPVTSSSAYENVDYYLLLTDKQDRRELLYTARGHQLQALQAEVVQLKEDIAKEKRLSSHRLLLAEGDKERLRSELLAKEDAVKSLRNELAAKQENFEVLQKQLQQNEVSQKKLGEELSALRSTNESLSSQLVELTTGNALKRAEEREAQLTQSLEQRFISKTEEIKAELIATQRHLTEKEAEVTDLRRQLEVSKAEIIKAQQTHNEMIKEANKQLEEAQKHCQQLASSSLCSEVTSLRQRVIELETSKKITDDVNKILQDELRDFRDQVSIYESVLKLDVYFHGNDENQILHETSEYTPVGVKGRYSGKSVAFADNDAIEHRRTNPRRRRPCSAIERPIHNAGGDTYTFTDWHSDEQSNRSQQNSKQVHSDSDDLVGKLNEHEQSYFQLFPSQRILTSTPAVSVISPKSPMAKLRSELERCLINYKAKREQITRLHEILYTTRCQLHQSKEESEKAEKSAKLLQERVLSLEQELSTLRSIGDNPGPREVVLSGQLERLRGDYAHLEEELQATRGRLQAALGSETKALEAEKTATERLAAFTAERDAAISRAKAVCEAEYTAMRRQLEADWSSERESNTRLAEEKLTEMRNKLCNMEREVQRVTNLYQESQMSVKKAVENALMEAMKLREAERMRFWREELPEQIEAARQSWILQLKAQNTGTNDLSNKFKNKGTQMEESTSVNVGVNTSNVEKSNICVQTELSEFLSMKFGVAIHEPITDSFNNNEIKSVLLNKYPVLSEYLPEECIFYLCTHLTETSYISIYHLEKEIASSSHNIIKHLLKQIEGEIDKLADVYKVAHVFEKNADNDFSSENRLTFKCLDPSLNSNFVSTTLDKSSAILEQTSPNYLTKYSKIQLSKMVDRKYQSVLAKIQLLFASLYDTSASLRKLESSSLNVSSLSNEHKSIQVKGLEAEHYYSTIQKIKADVLNYVELCQSRAAQILHSELARVHRRACRQFTSQLRQALLEAGAPIFRSSRCSDFPNKTVDLGNTIDFSTVKNNLYQLNTSSRDIGLSGALESSDFKAATIIPTQSAHSDLESLLHVIDEVCASTEAKFYSDTTTGSRLFSQFTVSNSHSDEIRQSPVSNSNMSIFNGAEIMATSSHDNVTHNSYIVPECKQHQSATLNDCSHIKQNQDHNLSARSVPSQFCNLLNGNNKSPVSFTFQSLFSL
ncbi:Centrosomal protein [Schistosoma japonicum]|uniref:Centrosomal protein n=1 Tax=Schistosoma japonicum TaxID=6182 RepID=A0A4Z2D0X8_SCHJA|nr:Centrosomal protein [Schistosoma japonicum]